uniref:RRM domain-containing protein n=1 Tax=Romanomermis culicivorax TaxID=13658 RepID=A0A915L9Q9_ROMCU
MDSSAADQNSKTETFSDEPKVYPLIPTCETVPPAPITSDHTITETRVADVVTGQSNQEIRQVDDNTVTNPDSIVDPAKVVHLNNDGNSARVEPLKNRNNQQQQQYKDGREYDLKALALKGFNKQHTTEVIKALFGPHADNISGVMRSKGHGGMAFVKFSSEDHCKAALEMLEANGDLIVENAPRPIIYSYKYIQKPNPAPNQRKNPTNNANNSAKSDPKHKNVDSKAIRNDSNKSKPKMTNTNNKSNYKPVISKSATMREKRNLKRLNSKPIGKNSLPTLMTSPFSRRFKGSRVYENVPKYEPPFLVSPFLNDRRDDGYGFHDSSRGGYGYPTNQSYDYNTGGYTGAMPMNSSFRTEPPVPSLMSRYAGESFNGFDHRHRLSYRGDDTFNEPPRERSRSPADRRDRGGGLSPLRNDIGKPRSGSLIESYCMLIAQRLERMNEQQQSYARMKIEEALYGAEFNAPGASSNKANNEEFRSMKPDGGDRYRSEQLPGQNEPPSGSYFGGSAIANVSGNRSRYQDSIFGGAGNLPSAADWMN